jgi:hypothetical protein
MLELLGNPDPCFSLRNAFGELSTLGQAPDQPRPGEHGCRTGQAEALPEELAFKGHDILLEDVHRPTIVTQSVVHLAQSNISRDLKGDIPRIDGKGEGTLAGLDGTVMVACLPEIGAHMGGDPPQSTVIVQGLSENFSFAQVVEHAFNIAQP